MNKIFFSENLDMITHKLYKKRQVSDTYLGEPLVLFFFKFYSTNQI